MLHNQDHVVLAKEQTYRPMEWSLEVITHICGVPETVFFWQGYHDSLVSFQQVVADTLAIYKKRMKLDSYLTPYVKINLNES